MIESLLLSLLHLLILVSLIRLLLPKNYVVLNPYGAGIDQLFTRLLGLLRSALPIGVKPLCGVIILLALAARATLLFKLGAADFQIGVFFVAHFAPTTFLEWVAFECLDFLAFWFTLQASVFLLRLWHFLRPLPGFVGDLMRHATHPLSSIPLWGQAPILIIWAALLAILPIKGAESIEFVPIPLIADLIQTHLLPGHAAPQAPFSVAQIGVAIFTYVPLVIAAIQSFLMLSLVIRIVSGFLKSKPVYFLTGELLNLFCGRLPRVGIGLFDLTPILAFFVLNVIVNALSILCGVLLYVV